MTVHPNTTTAPIRTLFTNQLVSSDSMETETTDAIIRATGRSLCEHGYADLTMQRIAEESDVTTAAIHYHFDTKEELLNAFLDDLLDRFETRLACEARDPRDRLNDFLNAVFDES